MATVRFPGARRYALSGALVANSGLRKAVVTMIDAHPPSMAELAARRSTLERIAAAHGAASIRVCGSVARGDARPDSDIDLVVDLDEDRDVLDVIELILDLQDELSRRVDVLAMPRSGSPSAHSPVHQILASAIPLTAEGPAPRPTAPPARDLRVLGELRKSLELARSYAGGDHGAFIGNDMAVDAVKHRLAEIADACGRLSPELKARHPDIRWRAVTALPVGTRHGPRGCWEIVTRHLASLDQLISRETDA